MSREPQLPIQTARLRLRRLVPGDLAALHAIHSREDVTRWLYWDPRNEGEVRTSLDAHIARPFDEGVVLAIDLE
ncbi:MAG: GNAT family N-acetyltransferase, partial [Actinobacteria bacterium]